MKQVSKSSGPHPGADALRNYAHGVHMRAAAMLRRRAYPREIALDVSARRMSDNLRCNERSIKRSAIGASQGAGITRKRLAWTIAVLALLGQPCVPDPGHAEKLTWPPPRMSDPIVINMLARPQTLRLATDRDYILRMPAEPVMGAVGIEGGRNVVLIGGEIRIPWQGDKPSIAQRRGLKIADATGTVHVEGLLLHGDDISEGIQIAAPQAIIQLQNVAVMGIHARDPILFSDNHPDLIQPYGGFIELRIDRFTGSSDYQGIFLKCDSNCPFGPVTIRRVNLIGLPTARYLVWLDQKSHSAPIVIDDFWLDVPKERAGGLGRSVWPDIRGKMPNKALVGVDDAGRTYVSWPTDMRLLIAGRIILGRPPAGDFAPAEKLGLNYVSPGYRDESALQDARSTIMEAQTAR